MLYIIVERSRPWNGSAEGSSEKTRQEDQANQIKKKQRAMKKKEKDMNRRSPPKAASPERKETQPREVAPKHSPQSIQP